MKKIILILLLIFISNSVFAQDYILKSSLDSSVVEYAHIAFLNVKDGTYSNEKGIFTVPQNVDSIYISHISFENKLVLRKDFHKIICLTASENALASIEIKSKKEIKKYRLPRSSRKLGLNVSSSEYGTTFIEENEERDSYITMITCPVKKGVDFSILKINLYSFDKNINLPDSLVWSALVEEEDYYKNQIVLSDLYIRLKKQERYFISLELVGYEQEGRTVFHPYKRYGDLLKIYLVKDEKQTCFYNTGKLGWHIQFTESGFLMNQIPLFWLEIE